MMDFKQSFEIKVGDENEAAIRDYKRSNIEDGGKAAERGYEATSIRTLAAKAHVNQAAINYHFKTKDGLYREVLRDQ